MINTAQMISSSFLPDFSSLSWWVSQIGPIILLVCLIVSMQQRTRKKLMWWNTTGMFVSFIFTFFLGVIPVIILVGINLARNIVVLIFSHFEKVDRWIEWTAGILLIIALVVANIIFWNGIMSIASIAVGTAFILAFFQPTPKRMRFGLALVRFPAATFHFFGGNFTQVITELVVFTSGLVGIIRLDIKRKSTDTEVDEKPKDVLEFSENEKD